MVIHALLAASLALTSLPAQAAQTAAVDCARVKCLALTFDDGPGKDTPALLKELSKAGAKATFFLVGKRVEERPEVARQIVARGHAIGNHTYSHASLPAHSDNEILDELKVTQEVIEEVTGRRPTMFRPPYGHTDERVLGLAGQTELAQILWTHTTLDWSLRDTKKIKATVLKMARRDGVILMHDVVPQTVRVMPEILRELKKRGYHLVTVPTLLRGKGPTPGESYF
ncbi:polysaccharide deacetylase family protein [Nonomuraea rubra]|uniref:Peptidoglycan/xylan/chitin deacetylase (PgdA/CDA1 family) n=1 Tax=Nonomuraea rubra TaxID=46180 RepID=A0A7X0P5X9_9ACTN|nr:polysaccharide deacetylase family protein [Nonomuraea rubra]MBB6555682.1 peptidoglycan/xylan/chitin deacetylase (PgdA/CDA1 family) [Nonomuraea rubra]